MPQQAGYGMHPSFGNFINDPTAQIGFQMGKTAMDAGQQYMEQNVRIHTPECHMAGNNSKSQRECLLTPPSSAASSPSAP